MIKVGKGVAGRGVLATKDIPANTEMCRCECLKIPNRQIAADSKIASYVFEHNTRNSFLVMGIISFINHNGNEPNCEVYFNNDRAYLQSIRPIKKGEELKLNYGYTMDDMPDWYYE